MLLTKPYPFQDDGVDALEGFNGRGLLADEQGLGKTLQALMFLERHPELRPAVVVCPASLKWVWEDEAAKHVGMRADVLWGRSPPKHGLRFKPQLTVVNYDVLKDWLPELLALKPKCVILDEAQYVSNRKSQRSRAVKELCKAPQSVIALTGTPITNVPAELYPIVNLVRPDLFPSWNRFANRYCQPRLAPWGWEYKGATHLGELHEILTRELMVRRLKADVLKDLPAKTRSVVPVTLSDPREYRAAERDFLTWLNSRDPAKMRKAARAEAVVRVGYLKRLVGELKFPAVTEWGDNTLKGTGGKLVVMAVHRTITQGIKDHYGKRAVLVNGSVSSKERERAVRQFQTSDSVRLFAGNIKAAGTGLTLTAASRLAFAELGWTPGEHAQAEDRIHRIGQKSGAHVSYLVAHGTVEEKLLKILHRKRGVANAVVDGVVGADDFDLLSQLVDELKKPAF